MGVLAVDLAEWVWTVVALTGVAVSIWAITDGMIDRRVQRAAAVNGAMRTVVRINLRSARASLVLHTFFLILGALALATPHPPLTPVYVLFASGYIVVATTNVSAVALNQVERLRQRRARVGGA
jgi:hypothetical protein